MDERSCMCCCDVVWKYVAIEVFDVLMSVSCFKIYDGVEMKSSRGALLDVVVYT
jgi:hypothetical protein